MRKAFVVTAVMIVLMRFLAPTTLSGSVLGQSELSTTLAPLGTGFTYQGELMDGDGNPITVACDFRFSLWDAASGGVQVGGSSTASAVQVADGTFSTLVNASGEFGAEAFNGQARFLEVAVVCPAGGGSFTALAPRQPLTAAPYASYAGEAGSIPWSGLSGVPPGFADGVDDDTVYTADGGVTLEGTHLSADTDYLQRRVAAVCPANSAIAAVAADGSVSCEADDDTTYGPGTGLTLIGGQFSLATGYRLPQSCAAGQIAEWNGASWDCGDDNLATGGEGDISAVYAGDGLSGGGTAGDVTVTVDFSGTGSAVTVARSDHDHDGAYAPAGHDHDDRYFTEGELSVSGEGGLVHWDNLDAVPASLVDGDDDTLSALSCAGGEVAQWNGSAWACDPDDNTDTLRILSCASGQLPRWNGSAWVCGDDWDTLYYLPCADDQIPRWTGTDWTCSDDLDSTYTAGDGLSLVGDAFSVLYDGTGEATSVARSDHGHDGAYWSLSGNSGTTPGTHYLGTSDNAALVLRVNNSRALRIEPSSEAPNLIGGWWENYVTAGVRGATVGGGGSGEFGENWVSDDFGTVGGGAFNRAGDDTGTTVDRSSATVGGGYQNTAAGSESTVSGGSVNWATGDGATVGGGMNNTAYGLLATVGGGGSTESISGNRATDNWTTVSGGYDNQAGDGADNGSERPFDTVGGGSRNLASGGSSTVAGGQENTASGLSSVVAGGFHSLASGHYANIDGGFANYASGTYATVGGGNVNAATAMGSVVAGGMDNDSTGDYAAIGGGHDNVASGLLATIGGGEYISVTGEYATVGGGSHIIVTGSYATVGGGGFNIANGTAAVVAGGGGHDDTFGYIGNVASANWGTIGGGGYNTVGDLADPERGMFGTVGGGLSNWAAGSTSTIGGGNANIASDEDATVSGGYSNRATGAYSTVGGGGNNSASGQSATVGGGFSHTASGGSAFVGGGAYNSASGYLATVSGGSNNVGSAQYTTIGGGGSGDMLFGNRATDGWATIGGGFNNQAGDDAGTPDDRPFGTVAGGRDNTASGMYATVGGGLNHEASGTASVVSGGDSNIASGDRSAVPGGVGNVAAGHHSFAAGRRAQAIHGGAFVWADSLDVNFASTNSNTFRVRATNGAEFVADNTGYGLIAANNGAGDGLRAMANSSAGTNWAAVYAVNYGTSPAVYADTSAGTYSGYFMDDIYVAGNCVGCTMVYVAQNQGTADLETGDLVAVSGLSALGSGGQEPVLEVHLAQEGMPVIGVVLGRAELVDSEREDQTFTSAESAAGAATPGDYLFIVVQGMAQVKADAGAGSIQPGERLTVGAEPGRARALQTREVEGMLVAEGAPVIGIALAAPESGSELIPVFVNLQ